MANVKMPQLDSLWKIDFLKSLKYPLCWIYLEVFFCRWRNTSLLIPQENNRSKFSLHPFPGKYDRRLLLDTRAAVRPGASLFEHLSLSWGAFFCLHFSMFAEINQHIVFHLERECVKPHISSVKKAGRNKIVAAEGFNEHSIVKLNIQIGIAFNFRNAQIEDIV